MRVFMTGFGIFFGSVGVAGYLSNQGALGLFIGGSMAIAGLWIAGMGIVNVQVRNGVRVGGGPLLPAVKLEPGESVIADSSATYNREERGPTGPESYRNLEGHVFLTDRRVIFSPFRFRYAARPVALALGGASSLGVGQRSVLMMGKRDVLELVMNDGSKHSIWFGKVAARDETISRFERGDFVDAGTIVPDRALRLHHVILGFVGAGIVIAFILGSTTAPYIRAPDGIAVWALVTFVGAMPLLALAEWLGVNLVSKFDWL